MTASGVPGGPPARRPRPPAHHPARPGQRRQHRPRREHPAGIRTHRGQHRLRALPQLCPRPHPRHHRCRDLERPTTQALRSGRQAPGSGLSAGSGMPQRTPRARLTHRRSHQHRPARTRHLRPPQSATTAAHRPPNITTSSWPTSPPTPPPISVPPPTNTPQPSTTASRSGTPHPSPTKTGTGGHRDALSKTEEIPKKGETWRNTAHAARKYGRGLTT